MTRRQSTESYIEQATYRPFGKRHKIANVRRSAREATLDRLYDQGNQTPEAMYYALSGKYEQRCDDDISAARDANKLREIRRYFERRKQNGKK